MTPMPRWARFAIFIGNGIIIYDMAITEIGTAVAPIGSVCDAGLVYLLRQGRIINVQMREQRIFFVSLSCELRVEEKIPITFPRYFQVPEEIIFPTTMIFEACTRKPQQLKVRVCLEFIEQVRAVKRLATRKYEALLDESLKRKSVRRFSGQNPR